ncbi:MAG: alpha-amylase family glycosyl hydrolase [Lachnospiraceae bacterium]|nr:alpha-amylase family glycosyl hydrolase [Lachnospiraceae bacterium]
MSKWYETAAFYHIYPLGMSGAPRRNTEPGIQHRFPKLETWLPHIRKLGCEAIYIGPLFESTSHGYDTIDYKLVDRRLGDNEDFVHFVKAAHELGQKIVVDGVFNHTGREFPGFADIQKNRENSRYCGWYKGINFGWNSAYNDGFGYETWRGCGDLVNLNLQNQEVKNYLFEVIRFWIHEFDIDGIRLDCADCLDFEFMKEMRRMTENEKKDFWLMGEVIHGDYSRWANPEMLHSVTNYELSKGLYSGHNDHNYFEIAHTICRQFDENGGIYRDRVLYSFLDNHDVSRIVNKLNNRQHLIPAYGLVYTLPGLPSIYYGSEWGVEGRKEEGDDALRPCLDPDELEKNPPVPGLAEWIAFLGKCRMENPVLAEGRYRELLLTNRQYAFARLNESEAVVTAVNNDDQDADLWIRLPMAAEKLTDLKTEEALEAENGQLHILVPANGCRLIRLN